MNKRVPLSELSPLMNEALQNGGEVVLAVTGTSMLPLLRHRRDKVRLVKPERTPLKKYDVPLYTRPDGKYILHRIVDVRPEGYAAVGDNQYAVEYPILPSQVVGVAKGFWRDGNYISCDDLRYMAYCRIWVSMFLLRRLYWKGKRLIIKKARFIKQHIGDNGYEE